MAQQIKALAIKPEDLSSNPKAHIMEGKYQLLQAVHIHAKWTVHVVFLIKKNYTWMTVWVHIFIHFGVSEESVTWDGIKECEGKKAVLQKGGAMFSPFMCSPWF